MLVQNEYDSDIRVRRKAEALVADGYIVDVLALRSAHAPSGFHQLNGVSVFTFPLGKKRGSQLRYLFEYGSFCFWAFGKLIALHRKRRYAMVDVNNLPDFLVFAAAGAKMRGARIVFDMHEITPEFVQSKYQVGPGHWQVRLASRIERLSMAYADHVIAINEPIRDLLAGRGLKPARSTVIMNSVDETMFDEARAAASPPQRCVMMYHGTLTRIYGLDIAIQALAIAHANVPEAEFWILGKGPERASLEALAASLGIASRVKFLGSVLPQEVPRLLSQCDVGVLATRQDVFLDLSFSNKLSEYIIMDKPVICSRLKSIRHYFNEDALAFFQPANPEDLARQMVRVLRDPALRASLVTQARQQYQPICWDVMKRRYLALVESIVGPPRPTPSLATAEGRS
jgi:glycosyltransferase involved in cell wall biosynthesis